MITPEIINECYTSSLRECFDLFPAEKWKHSPAGVDMTDHKGKYGMATAKGVVLINKAFLGTNSTIKLRNTMRHELAHLAVGLKQSHNKVFRCFEALFDALVPVPPNEIEAITNNISYKWQVIAHLVDGTQRDLGGAHMKTKLYAEYPYNGRSMSIGQIKVEQFEFVAN